jgi:hypothetical protein
MPEQFDLERGLWIIPPVLVKQLQQRLRLEDRDIPPYMVPVSRQAIVIVRQLLEAKPPAARYLLSRSVRTSGGIGGVFACGGGHHGQSP